MLSDNSLPTEGQSEAIVGTEAIVATEASSPLTESLADTISRVVDGLRQSLGEGCSSSTSSDSLSSVVTANYSGITNDNSVSVCQAKAVLWFDLPLS